MYRYRYINKHTQFGYTSYTLILEDLEDGLPTCRIDKTFQMDPETIDNDFLYAEAKKEILNAMDQPTEPAIKEEESTEDSE